MSYHKILQDAMLWDGANYSHTEQDKFDRLVTSERKEQGIDCSELVEFSYSPHVPEMPDGARNQFCFCLEKGYKEVSKEEAITRKGCLAFYFSGSRPTKEVDDTYSTLAAKSGFSVPHVGITMGDGSRVFHAINTSMGVKGTGCWDKFTVFFDPFSDTREASHVQPQTC